MLARAIKAAALVLLLSAGVHAGSVNYYLFVKKSSEVLSALKEYPFKYEDEGTLILLKKGPKDLVLKWGEEVKTRLKVPTFVGAFTDEGFKEYLKEENFNFVSGVIRDLEKLKELMREVKSPNFNSCYYVSAVNVFEVKLLKRYGVDAYGLLKKEVVDFSCYLKDSSKKSVEDVLGYLKALVNKYEDYPSIRDFLEKQIGGIVKCL